MSRYCLVGIGIMLVGVLYWAGWQILLPKVFGYELIPRKETLSDGTVITLVSSTFFSASKSLTPFFPSSQTGRSQNHRDPVTCTALQVFGRRNGVRFDGCIILFSCVTYRLHSQSYLWKVIAIVRSVCSNELRGHLVIRDARGGLM